MDLRLLALRSFALMVLCIGFVLSLIISPKVAGGFKMEFHSGLLVNFVLAVIYLVIMGREVRFRPWSAGGTVLILFGCFLGVSSIVNVILINPFKDNHLLYAFVLELLVLINFRNVFMPFHHRGRKLTLNLLMVIFLALIFKCVIMSGIEIPIIKMNDAYRGYFNMPLMSMVWLVSLTISFIGLYVMGLSIRNENGVKLESIKSELNLDQKHLIVLGLNNQDLLGLSKHEVEDSVYERIREIIGESKRYDELQAFVKNLPDPENSWAAPLALESKQRKK